MHVGALKAAARPPPVVVVAVRATGANAADQVLRARFRLSTGAVGCAVEALEDARGAAERGPKRGQQLRVDTRRASAAGEVARVRPCWTGHACGAWLAGPTARSPGYRAEGSEEAGRADARRLVDCRHLQRRHGRGARHAAAGALAGLIRAPRAGLALREAFCSSVAPGSAAQALAHACRDLESSLGAHRAIHGAALRRHSTREAL
mmetsp:Transcript_71247/g.189449  ORF Transcript_71247/g.189449 Transcript_71247/m.189449 type:complete len:206 (+) Transcript_71247:1540-2157(+)